MKRILRGLILGVLIVVLTITPVLAYYYGTLKVIESQGNSHTQIPVIASINASMLADNGFMTSTGLDTRVLTGDGYPLPHVLADDKVLFVTNLAARETKELIFYMGAVSLSSFPIVVGYNGSFETPDDPDLELGYVMELLIDGYFNSGASYVGSNILYKEDAFRVYISAANTIKVQALNSTGGEQWEMNYNNFTTGEHTVYIVCNGLAAYLYVDAFVTAKDTANLFDHTSYQYVTTDVGSFTKCFYDQGYYWVFYPYNTTALAYKTSPDGVTWSGNVTFDVSAGYSLVSNKFDATVRDSYIHLCYYSNPSGTDYVWYRRGELNSTPGITWSTDWHWAASDTTLADSTHIAVDANGYPAIAYEGPNNTGHMTKSTTNNGTFTGAPFQMYYTGANPTSVYSFNYYPNSNKLLVIYRARSSGGLYTATYARYFNGVSWEAEDNISAYVGDTDWISMAADANDNMYIGWSSKLGVGGDKPNQYLSIRYNGEVWFGPLTLTLDGKLGPGVSYNGDNGVVYVLYPYDGATDYVYCVTLNTVEMELNTPIAITTLLTDSGIYGVNRYSDHIGWTMDGGGDAYHAFIDLTAYHWEDNGNSWEWIGNNVMPYIDDIQMAIDGVTHLQYKPQNIIHGTTLVDISGASDNDAEITWGVNLDGVDTEMGPLTSSGYQPPPGLTPGAWPTPQDVMPTTGGEGIAGGLGSLEGNVFYPVISVLSMLSGLFPGKDPIPIPLMWVIVASLILIFTMVVCVWKMPHQLITVIVGMLLIIVFNRMGIYPWWVYLIYVPVGIAIVMFERKPAL